MRWLVSFIVIALLAVGLGVASRHAQGYVLFVLPHTRIEMSLTLFVLLTVAAFMLLYAALHTLWHLWRLPARVQAYQLHRRRNRAHSAMHEAMTAYLEGHFERAETAAARLIRLQDSPQLGAALAAQAAQARGDSDKGEQYLALVEAETPQVSRLLQMTQASLLQQRGSYQEALKVLESVIAAAPKYAPALRLALRCHSGLAAWAEVERIAAQLAQLGLGQDPLVREAQQAAGRQARDALTRTGAQATSAASADVVTLRPRQSGGQ